MAAGIADLGLLLNKTMGGLSFLHLGSKGLTSVLSEEIDIMQAEQAGEQTNPVTVELPNQ
ncbi:MAG: hypothetical protein HC848_10795 [Limnobacter sp.]|nr:hypothetical protein [Limnobacter sp.]